MIPRALAPRCSSTFACTSTTVLSAITPCPRAIPTSATGTGHWSVPGPALLGALWDRQEQDCLFQTSSALLPAVGCRLSVISDSLILCDGQPGRRTNALSTLNQDLGLLYLWGFPS